MNLIRKKYAVHEDWTVVILGSLIILISFSGLIIQTPAYGWTNTDELINSILSIQNIIQILTQFVFVYVLAASGAFITGKSLPPVMAGFPLVYILTTIALIIAGNAFSKILNLEAVIFSLAFGLLIGNFFPLSESFKSSLSTELFVKIGLVLLGTSVIFTDILKAGLLGLVQSLAVVISVWYFAYWLCKKLKVDDELTMMISSAVSICGVSAAIAASGAIQGD